MGQIEMKWGKERKTLLKKWTFRNLKYRSLSLSFFFILNKKANKNAHSSLMSTKNVQLSPSFFSNETPLQQKKSLFAQFLRAPNELSQCERLTDAR
jgi:hypothetical protein